MDKLIRERKSLEPRLKRISDAAAKIKPEEAEEVEVQSELDALCEVWAGYGALYKRIIGACDDGEEYEDAVKHQANFEELYISVKNRLMKITKAVREREGYTANSQAPNDVIQQLAAQQTEFLRLMATNMATSSTSSTAANSFVAASPLSDLKLPRMNLPTFSGNYLEWQSFFDLFESLVHANPSLKDSQRLYFLKTNLDGEAASLISHLKIEDANYRAALDKLKARYDKPREIANKHIQRFLAQQTLTTASASGLRSLHDVSDEVIRALKAMNREDRDTWLLFILSEKLDSDTKQVWCQKISEMNEEDITLQAFLKFLESRSFALHAAQPTRSRPIIPFKPFPKAQARSAMTYVATNSPFCTICSNPHHHIYQCGKFLHMGPDDRLAHVNHLQLCLNCLKPHQEDICRSGMCRKCHQPHHTLLHSAVYSSNTQQTNESLASSAPVGSSQPLHSLISALDAHHDIDASNVLLATAAVDINDNQGRRRTCRAVLDSASQVSFITERCCNELGIKTRASNMELEGISSVPTRAHKCAEIIITSRCSDFRAVVPCMVLDKITNTLPCKQVSTDDWTIPDSIHLADPFFHRPGRIDVLLGIEIFFQLLQPGQISLNFGGTSPTLQNTKLGWVVAGRFNNKSTVPLSPASTCLLVSTEDELSQQLRKFWELEEYAISTKHLTEEEQICERHFSQNTVRNESGTFVVRLPFLLSTNNLGDSYQMAQRRLNHIERKLERNPQLKTEYHEFMREYLDLGHMSLVGDAKSPTIGVYLPHHCDVKGVALLRDAGLFSMHPPKQPPDSH
ncbi:uncharacterized protein LOC134222785 [Armigeres subalbatus]|uniref:uncharacterized protein LOC134222785 n=1 Tax=Armigeres subalbatus TaxID=124917 RepID=UPI002ED57EA2